MILTHHGIDSLKRRSAKTDLLTIFYGDLENGQYKFRWLCDDVASVNNNVNNNTIKIVETRKDDTPLGNDTAVFNYYDQAGGSFFCMAYFTAGAVPFGDFTTDFWVKTKDRHFGEHFIASQCRIRDVSDGTTRNLNHGPSSKEGIGYYYNYMFTSFDIRFLNNTPVWTHYEFDFDYATKTLFVWINGVFAGSQYVGDHLMPDDPRDYFHASRVTNDGGQGAYDRIITQLALWRKKMNGACFSLGLYHDGTHLLI